MGSSELNPLVSILIPSYNCAEFISRSIESAIAQKYRPIEIIAVDNASTDATYDVLKSYEENFSFVRVFKNDKNLGPVLNWSRCAREAKGEYACLLFSDDWYHEGFVEILVKYMHGLDVGFAYSPVISVSSPVGTIINNSNVMYMRDNAGCISSKVFLVDQLYLSGNEVPLSPGCALFRLNDMRDALSVTMHDPFHVRYLSHGAGPDVLIYLMTLVKYKYFAFSKEPLVYFLNHDNNLSKGASINVSYALAKVWFVMSYKVVQSELNMGKFRAAHLWRLLANRKLIYYKRSLVSDNQWYDIAWIEIALYVFKKIKRYWYYS